MSPEGNGWPGADPAPEGSRFAGRGLLLDRVGSTIDACRSHADEGAPEGFFVLARTQEAARGQHGHRWVSPPGTSLSLSVLLRPLLAPQQAGDLVPLAGLAACRAVRELSGVACLVKRPNDLVVPHGEAGWRKLGGVLIDTAVQGDRLRHAILSVGLNVNVRPEELPKGLRGVATSLLEETARPHAVGSVAAALLGQLEALLPPVGEAAAPGWSEAIAAWLAPVARDLPHVTFPDRFEQE